MNSCNKQFCIIIIEASIIDCRKWVKVAIVINCMNYIICRCNYREHMTIIDIQNNNCML